MSETAPRELSGGEDSFTILKALLEAPGQFVSGSILAKQLGISRPAVWGKLKKLQGQGFRIEAIRNRGYRLEKEPAVLHPDLVRYYLEATDCPVPVNYFPVIDSTNSEAERQLSFGRATPFAIASSCQTKGRGRLGRNWFSASADNLYLSVVFEPDRPPQRLQDFTLWAGIEICEVLQRYVGKVPLRIKWPNDLLCDGRKFAGMLTEAKMDADRTRSIVFGIGLNLNSNPSSYPPELRRAATSLYAAGGEALPINRVTASVVAAVCRAYQNCIENPAARSLVDAWSPLDALAGQAVSARRGDEVLTGTAAGIDATGALVLRDAKGHNHTVRAGDVTLAKN